MEDHDHDHEWERGDIIDREGSSLIREYYCISCDKTFTELEQADEPAYDWSDLD